MYKAKSNIWDVESTDNFERVCNYIETKRNKIAKINKCYEQLKSVLKQYFEATKHYREQLASIALKLLPNSDSFEGKLIQAIQGILLYNSESLEHLTSEIQLILKNIKKNKILNYGGLDEFSKMYQINYSKVVNLYCDYITEYEMYEKYLIHKELDILNKNKNNEENNGNNDNNKQDGDKIEINNESNEIEKGKRTKSVYDTSRKSHRKEIRKGSRKESGKDVLPKKEKPKQKKEEKLVDNHENVVKAEKTYVDFVAELNVFIKKLIEFGWNEERILKKEFYNNCQNFVDKLIECMDIQKKKYENQHILIAGLDQSLNQENLEDCYLQSSKYSLHSLSIYMNNKSQSKENNEDMKQKGEFDNELYKNLKIENIENIINEMQKNGVVVRREDLHNFEREKNIDFIGKNIELIFYQNSKLSLEKKNEMIELFKKDEEYILFFLQKLNNDRSMGGKITDIEAYHQIGEIFKLINNMVLEKNDFECFKYVAILAMTYYRMDGDNRIYVYEYIKDHPSFLKFDFWEKYFETLIFADVNSCVYSPKSNTEKKLDENEEKFKLGLASFSNILIVVNNMIDFGLKKDFIEKFIDFANKKYEFSKEQMEQINSVLEIYEEKSDNDSKTKVDEENKGEVKLNEKKEKEIEIKDENNDEKKKESENKELAENIKDDNMK